MTTVAIGTEKGGYLLRSDVRRTWDVQGPLFAGWKPSPCDDSFPRNLAFATGSGMPLLRAILVTIHSPDRASGHTCTRDVRWSAAPERGK